MQQRKPANRARNRLEAAPGSVSPHLHLPAETAIGYHLRLTSEQLRVRLQERLRPLGIRLAQWQYLRVLWDRDGISQRELGELVARMGPNTVSAINILERSGLVKRKRSSSDRRIIRVFLTPKARHMQDAMIQAAMDVMLDATRGITQADALALLRTLKIMQDNLARV